MSALLLISVAALLLAAPALVVIRHARARRRALEEVARIPCQGGRCEVPRS